MQANLLLLDIGVTEEQRAVIYKDASTCGELMTYSYLVADTESPKWRQLDSLVTAVMVKARKLEAA